MRHIISVLLENEAGALSRVAGLFSARGFNIESLVVAQTNDPSLSRLTLVSIGSDRIIEQIVKQLEKLIDTVSVIDLTGKNHIEHELLLIKLTINENNENKINDTIKVFSGNILDTTNKVILAEVSATSKQLDAFLATLDKDDILEISRSGTMGLLCGNLIL